MGKFRGDGGGEKQPQDDSFVERVEITSGRDSTIHSIEKKTHERGLGGSQSEIGQHINWREMKQPFQLISSSQREKLEFFLEGCWGVGNETGHESTWWIFFSKGFFPDHRVLLKM